MLRAAAGRLVLLCLPTYGPWLNPIETLWRHFRREITHCELFANIEALLTATRGFVDRYDRVPGAVRSIIGSHPISIRTLYSARFAILNPASRGCRAKETVDAFNASRSQVDAAQAAD